MSVSSAALPRPGGSGPCSESVRTSSTARSSASAFERLGGRGWKQGLAAAQVENAALWIGFVVIDRVHCDRRSGAWPRLLTNPRVAAYEVALHALFGVVLGTLLTDE